MSLGPNEQFSETQVGPRIRVQVDQGALRKERFARHASAPTLVEGTPLQRSQLTNEVSAWAVGATLYGFLLADVELLADDEVDGYVMIRGIIHYRDVAAPSGVSQPQLDELLLKGCRELGFQIQGLPGAGQHFTDPDT